jgi:ectoine hydroxylase-related dioxygenase (phytanoyl-CoA dioxygenase family)
MVSSRMPSVRDLPRLDPAQVEFTANAIDTARAARVFHDAGFIIVRGLMLPHVDAMAAEVRDAVALAHRELPEARTMRYGRATASGGIFSDRASTETPPRLRLICAPLTTANSPTMRACGDDARLRSILAVLLGDGAELLGGGHCMYKEAGGGFESSLHQDAIYPGAEDHVDVVYVFTYVVPTPIERGCIWIVPYSHRLGLLAHDTSGPREGAIPTAVCDFGDALPFEGQAGDTLIWKYTVIHGSKANVTDLPRPSVMHRYGTRGPRGSR